MEQSEENKIDSKLEVGYENLLVCLHPFSSPGTGAAEGDSRNKSVTSPRSGTPPSMSWADKDFIDMSGSQHIWYPSCGHVWSLKNRWYETFHDI